MMKNNRRGFISGLGAMAMLLPGSGVLAAGKRMTPKAVESFEGDFKVGDTVFIPCYNWGEFFVRETVVKRVFVTLTSDGEDWEVEKRTIKYVNKNRVHKSKTILLVDKYSGKQNTHFNEYNCQNFRTLEEASAFSKMAYEKHKKNDPNLILKKGVLHKDWERPKK